jgi:hypothetical protein
METDPPPRVSGMASGEVNASGGSWTLPTQDGVARPARPELSDRTPPPVSGKAAIPEVLRRTQGMLYVAVALVFFGIVVMIMTRGSLVSSLVDTMHEQDSTIDKARLTQVAPLIIYAGIVALLLVVIPEWLVAVRLSRRRRGPRRFLVPLAILHLLVVVLCVFIVPMTSWQGYLLVAALVISGLLALVASVRTYARSVTTWLKARDDDGSDTDSTASSG